jgi:hypothetical protein
MLSLGTALILVGGLVLVLVVGETLLEYAERRTRRPS